MCGQQRPEKAFAGAGGHQMEWLVLRGQGRGQGFDRTVGLLTAAMLDFLAMQLERARKQVEHLRALAHAQRPPVVMCPQCGWAAVWSETGWSCPRCSLVA